MSVPRVSFPRFHQGQVTWLAQHFGAHALNVRFDPIVHYRKLAGLDVKGALGLQQQKTKMCKIPPRKIIISILRGCIFQKLILLGGPYHFACL